MNTPPPPPPFGSTPPPPPPPPPPSPTPAKSGNRTLIIILCIVIGFLVLVGGCVSACVYYGAKKAKEYSSSAQKNPQLVTASLIAAIHPDLQVVTKDEAAGTITLRNKKTGEVVKLDMSQYSADNIAKTVEQFAKGFKIPPAGTAATSSQETSDDSASSSQKIDRSKTSDASESEEDSGAKITPARAAALSATLKKFPNYLAAYPGSTPDAASINSLAGYTAGNYSFVTSDSTDAVVAFYEKKIVAAGFTVASKSNDTNDYGQTAQIMGMRTEPEGTFSLTAEPKEHGVHVDVNYVQH